MINLLFFCSLTTKKKGGEKEFSDLSNLGFQCLQRLQKLNQILWLSPFFSIYLLHLLVRHCLNYSPCYCVCEINCLMFLMLDNSLHYCYPISSIMYFYQFQISNFPLTITNIFSPYDILDHEVIPNVLQY